MNLRVQPAIIGCAIERQLHDTPRSLEEVLFHTSVTALRSAGLTFDDIDGIVVAGNDQYDGRAISIMAASGSVGGVDRDILSTPSASEHAFVLGALRVASGQYRTQLIVAWSPTEAHSLAEVQRLAADPYFHRRLPLDETASHALQACALEAVAPETRDLAQAIAAKNRRQGALARPEADQATASGRVSPPWPLTEEMISPPSSGAAALVLASADFVRERGASSAAWLRGMGWATECSFMGDRNLSTAPALDAAVSQAYASAGVSNPLQQIALAEVADATPYQELLAYEGLRFCSRADWAERVGAGAFGRGGGLPVNLSGGAQSNNPVFCTGLISIAETANQVLGRAGPHQCADPGLTVAHAASGFAMQYQTVVVLGREQGAVR
jgi:acetyl-CoA C-acetyltransferase